MISNFFHNHIASRLMLIYTFVTGLKFFTMKRCLVLFALIFSISIHAQTKLLSIEDALVKNRSTLAPASLKQLQFIYGTDDYVYLKNIDGKDVWVRGNAKTAEQPFLNLQQLNNKLKAAGRDTLTAMTTIQFNKSADWILTVKGSRIAVDPITNTAKIIIDKSIAQKPVAEESSAGYVAYLDNDNLFVTNGVTAKQVTTDGSKDIVYASSVHREEFGISKGTFWSNNGKLLAFYRMDQSMVTDYPIIDWSVRPAKVENIKYPMAGDKSHHVTVGVYNAGSGKTIYLQTGEPAEQYLTNIAWSPDDKYVFIAVLNREQNHMKLNQYDAASGALIKTLFEETDAKYVEPLNPMRFLKNDPSQFIWQSNRDGWDHLYLYDINGKLVRQLTKGEWEVTEVKGFDNTGENLFYVSTEMSPLSRNLYALNIKTGNTKRITSEAAVHNGQVSSSGKYVIDVYSDPLHAKEVQLIETATGKTTSLFSASNPLADYALGQMSIFTIPNATGIPLY
jgi:dipeptidyl-peptidase-4